MSRKKETFAEHLENVFKPIPATDNIIGDEIDAYLQEDLQPSKPLKLITPRKVNNVIKNI